MTGQIPVKNARLSGYSRPASPRAANGPASDGRHFLIYYYPFEDVHGERMVLELGFDISPRKQAEDSLRKASWQGAALRTTCWTWSARPTPGASSTFVSPSYRNILGYEREELLGHSVSELVHPDDLQGVVEAFTQAGEALEPGKTEYRYRRADGDYIWLETIGNPLFDETGELLKGHLYHPGHYRPPESHRRPAR